MFQIDDDVLLFLNGHLGKDDNDAFVRCSNFAYRDMCRTITYSTNYNEKYAESSKDKKTIKDKKRMLRDDITDLIKAQVYNWINNSTINKDVFNDEHRDLCNKIIEKYTGTTNQGEPNGSIYFGQAQKWVNMTLKNLYVYSKSNKTLLNLDNIIEYLHVPIDNVILDIASGAKICYIDPPGTKYGVEKPANAWSKWNDKEYEAYQDTLRNSIGNVIPIIWELQHWSTIKD